MDFDSRITEIFKQHSDAHIALMSFVQDVHNSLGDIKKQHREIVRKLKSGRKSDSGGQESITRPGTMEVQLTKNQVVLLREVMTWKTQIVLKYPDLLARTAFIYVIALFDGLLADAFATVLSYRPEVMSTSKKQLSYESIIRLHRSSELIQFMATREMNEVSYSSIRDQARYYLDRFGIDLAQSGVTITELTDISATRNLLVHNNGVVNSLYLETVPHSTCKLGDTINLTIPDVEKVGRKLRVVSSFLHKVIVKKFSTQPLDRQTP